MQAKWLIPFIFVFLGQNISASAQWVRVVVTRHDGGCAPCCPGTEIDEFLDPGEDATFNLSTCAKRVNITTSSSTVDIGRLTFTGGPSAFPLDIVLGSGGLNQSDTPNVLTGRHWEGLDASAIRSAPWGGLQIPRSSSRLAHETGSYSL